MGKNKHIPVLITIMVIYLAVAVASGLQVSGARLDTEVSCGDHLSHTMRISEAPTDVQIDIFGFGQTLDGAQILLNASQDVGPYSARPFLKISANSFHLEPGEVKEVTLEGEIPSICSGGKYALIHVYAAPQNNGTIGIATAVIIPILLTITGSEIIHVGEIENLSVANPITGVELNISFLFKNTGNHHYKIRSNAVVMDKDGNIVANATDFNLGSSIIPDASRLIKFNIKPENHLKAGDYTAKVTVNATDGAFLASKEVQFRLN